MRPANDRAVFVSADFRVSRKVFDLFGDKRAFGTQIIGENKSDRRFFPRFNCRAAD